MFGDVVLISYSFACLQSGVSTAVEEAQALAKFFKQRITKGEEWCLLDMKWMQQWIAYTGFDIDTYLLETPTSGR